MCTTGLIGRNFGPAAIAGYGVGTPARIPARPARLRARRTTGRASRNQYRRRPRRPRLACRPHRTGAAIGFGISEAIGVSAALFPAAGWLVAVRRRFRADRNGVGPEYLRTVGPFYGFFGLGLALYFSSQGAGRLLWPLCAGLIRLVIAIGGGWIALSLTGSLAWLFAALGLALVAYGMMIAGAVGRRVWFAVPRAAR